MCVGNVCDFVKYKGMAAATLLLSHVRASVLIVLLVLRSLPVAILCQVEPRCSVAYHGPRNQPNRMFATGMMQAACVAIGVLTFGHKQRGEADIAHRIEQDDERWLYEDIRKTVTDKDRNNKVQQGVDGSNTSTFVCVMSQSAFLTMVIFWLQYFIDAQDRGDDPNEYNLLAAGCNSGWHRASTFGMVLVMCLNRLVWPDLTRRFNAQAFQVQQLWSRGPINALIDTVVDWARSPFGTMPGGHDQDHTTLFGYSSSLQNRACSDNWNYLMSWVDAFNTKAINSVKAKLGPRPPQTLPPSHSLAGVPPPPALVAAASSATSASTVPTPPPPPPRPLNRANVEVEADQRVIDACNNDDYDDHLANLPCGDVRRVAFL